MTNRSVTVVMIDDDRDDFEIVRSLLDRGAYNRYEPVWIANYEEGLERLSRQDGDIFLIDYNLGEKTGLTLLEEAGGKSLRKPVIVLTGADSPEVDFSAMEAGASYYLQKSSLIVDHLLERTIRYSIQRAKSFEELRSLDILKVERDAAAAASQAKNLFLANVSHEFRTPLSAIVGYSELALNCWDPGDNQKFNEIIKRNAEHLLALVNDLLDLTKIEAGRYEHSIEPCDWRKVIHEVFQTFELSAAKKGNRLVFTDNALVPQLIDTDIRWFRQILLNLVGNAIKFTEKGEIDIRVEGGSRFRLFVNDCGMGMSEEEQGRIFRPFAQGDPKIRRRFGGTGLGLHLSRQIAQSLGGALFLVRSAKGEGATFCLSLPLSIEFTSAKLS